MEDSFGRQISYLRLSVTDRCDFRCRYCLPASHRDFASPSNWLTPIEIERVVRLFALLGVRHVRLTGGEPLVRKELVEIAQRIHSIQDIDEISLSSNASRLAVMAPALREAGISRLNISLDSLQPDMFHELTGGRLPAVMAGIDAALQHGFKPIKLNMVVMRGYNDQEIEAMIDFCMQRTLTLRLIETMPVGRNGIEANQHYLPLSEIQPRLQQRYRLRPAAIRGSGPARYFQIDDTQLVIGFITPQSQHFCDSCNRVRLSVEGDLHLCLGSEQRLSLRTLIRNGASDEEITNTILQGVRHKPQRHHFGASEGQPLLPMSALGG